MSMIQGTIPFPRTNPTAITKLSNDLRQMSSHLGGSAGQVAQTASATQSSWTGLAGDKFRSHLMQRSATMANMGRTIGRAAPVLDVFVGAMASAQGAYTAAAITERAAQAAIPFSAPAVAAAIAAEGVALGMLQAAGVACGGALIVLELELLAAELFGVSRSQFDAVKTAAMNIWDDLEEAVEEGDLDAVISALNTTVEIPRADGGSTRYNPMGMLIDAIPNLDQGLDFTQYRIATNVLLTTPPLKAVKQPDTTVRSLIAQGYRPNAATAADHGRNMDLLELFHRAQGTAEKDQSLSIFHTQGTNDVGHQVLNLTIPGIVEPGADALYGRSGTRNLPNAMASQIAHTGVEEASIREWVLEQELPPGSTVNLFGHSQGGIVARNVANDLAELGFDVNVVSYGSPDGEFHPSVDAFIVQNTRDPVPLARLAGDSDSKIVFTEEQRLIQFDHEIEGADISTHHNAITYGTYLDDNDKMSIDTMALQNFLADQAHVDLATQGVVTFEGPLTPDGDPVTVPLPYSVD